MTKRILFLTSSYPSAQNPNAGIFVKYQCEALRKQYETLLITFQVDYQRMGFFHYRIKKGNHVNDIHLLIRRSFLFFNQVQIFFILFYETIKRGKKFSPDIIHANISYPGAFWAFLVSVFLKRPYLVSEHTKLTNNYRSSIHKWLTNFGLRRAAEIITVGRKHNEDFIQCLNRTPSIIPNIVNLKKFTLINRETRSPVQIGFVGNMETPVKGTDILLQALAQLKIDYQIQIAGKGKLLPAYKKLAGTLGIESKCVFCGFLPHSEVKLFLEKIDFIVCASRYETFGLLLAEAIACGIPAVATKCGGPEDFIDDSNGLLVPPENTTALAEAIEKMASTFKQYDKASMREKIIRQFSEECFLQKIKPLYDSVLKHSKD